MIQLKNNGNKNHLCVMCASVRLCVCVYMSTWDYMYTLEIQIRKKHLGTLGWAKRERREEMGRKQKQQNKTR